MGHSLSSAISIAAIGVAACTGARDGTRPDDMGVAGHEAAAVHWLSAANPGAEDQAKYQRAHAVAAQHRAAAQALFYAEARACVGIAFDDRDISPFARLQDIESVAEVLHRPPQQDNSISPTLRGASIRFRPVPGLTREWLQRIVDCHLARNASLGHPTEIPCPLALKGVNAVVKEAGAGLVVEVTSVDSEVASEILARSQRLGPPAQVQPQASNQLVP